jgi:tripartite-type tricarboxylate transporter receptor subunit TctC
VTLFLSAAGTAQTEDFFKGKTIRFIVGYSPGGTFDAYTRTIARHLAKHVPGNPTIIVDNMTGAGGIVAANHLYNRAKPDGLTIGGWAAPLVLQHIMGNTAAQFDGRRFGYVGVPSPYETVCIVYSRPRKIHTAPQPPPSSFGVYLSLSGWLPELS